MGSNLDNLAKHASQMDMDEIERKINLEISIPKDLTHAASYTVCPAGPPACDYSVIQNAVDAAGEGDVIKIAAGTYNDINNLGYQLITTK